MSNIHEPREAIQPYEYPHLLRYSDVIHESFWTAEHFTYDRDIRDFRTNFKPHWKLALTRSMLAVGVVENKVKTFWPYIERRYPKAEISDAGFTFGGNEVVHRRAYEKLLNLLGLEKEFKNVLDVPCMKDRIKYLTKYLDKNGKATNKEFVKSLITFVLWVENCSLFSQFLIISSFNKYENVLNNFNAVVCATGREENIHAQFGAELLKIIREENPDWFDSEMYESILKDAQKAFKAECKVLDWIFEHGELEFLSKDSIKEYLKKRINKSMCMIGYADIFDLNKSLLQPTEYFDKTIECSISFDFFNEKSSEYSETNLITDDAW